MIAVQKVQTLKDEIKSALQCAKQQKHPFIFSYVMKLDKQDPLQVYSLFDKSHAGERFFWSTPERDFMLCGIGIELTLTNDKDSVHRFYTIEAMWNEWKQYTYIIGSKNKIGTGPILFGGFSFDPKKANENAKWKEFSTARFHLPIMMVTKCSKSFYLTINKVLHGDEDPDKVIKEIQNYNEFIHKNSFHKEDRSLSIQQKIIFDKDEWLYAVEKARKQIKQNDFEKAVLAREVLLTFNDSISISSVLKKLEKDQSSSYLFSFEIGEKSFVGATPERLVKKIENQVLSTCLAGSIKRGKTEEEDLTLGEQLLVDKKNLHEHEIVVKMIHHAFEHCCSEIETLPFPTLLKTQNIQHLYTPIKGTIKEGFSLMDIVAELHPTPALGGYPKEEALTFIRREEPMERGWYAAPIGWFDLHDNGEFVVAIRSGLIEGQHAYLFAGCGIVEDSVPDEEFMETEIKLGPMLHALGGTYGE